MNLRHSGFLFAITVLNTALFAQSDRPDVCPRNADDFAAIEKKVEAHDPVAQTALASCYDLGLHVQPNGKETIHWLTEAASQGYSPAQYELGRIYLYGRGIPADYGQALLWERKAAEQGDPRAQRDLAFMYERGFGVIADPAQATEWNRKAAIQGNAEAQLHLAKAFDEGAGVSRDSEEARKWYANAARQDQPTAQLELARESAGQGNCPVAVHWYEEAAEHGLAQAMYELGRLHLSNRCGVNRSQAYTWFTIGARFGLSESKTEADKLDRVLTAQQKKQARMNAEEWIRKHPGSDQNEDEEEKR